jgi:hypothetical protein
MYESYKFTYGAWLREQQPTKSRYENLFLTCIFHMAMRKALGRHFDVEISIRFT